MDPWTISALYEIGGADDRERAAWRERGGRKPSSRTPRPTARERAAAALLALAVRLAPSIEEALPESRPVATAPQL